jgi:hypothetical protein
MPASEELIDIWAANHRDGDWRRLRDNAFICGLLALKTSGPGTRTTLRAEECAPWEEAAIVGGLLLGARSVYAAIMALPDEEFPFAAGFSNAALGKVFDVLTDAFDVPCGDISGREIQDALDRAGLFGCAPLEMDRPVLIAITRCAGPVFDFETMTARPGAIRDCALEIRAARLERINRRQAAEREEGGGNG